MKRVLGDLAVTLALIAAASMDVPDAWRTLARACQITAEGFGRVGMYAERRAAVLTSEAA